MLNEETDFQGLFLIKNREFQDLRGSLTKFFYSDFFDKFNFKVDDIYTTTSNKNVVRGLHHQSSPYGQSKLVSCISGEFMDIAVDLRGNSETYGQIFKYKLKAGSCNALLIPAGFSHGTFSLEDGTIMLSICSGRYLPEYESGININSLDLSLDLSNAILSEKDKLLAHIDEFFD